MIVKILASGSSGNSSFIHTESMNILIDCGITKKRINDVLKKINYTIDDIDYILITHEHIDHIKSLAMLLKYTTAKVILTEGTFEYLIKNEKYKDIVLENENRFIFAQSNGLFYEAIALNGVKITPIRAFHDALEPVGYMVEVEGNRLVSLTDTGYVHKDLFPILCNANVYIWETNHDPEILMNSDRPYELKMRILSDHGHLSNGDSLYALANLVGVETKYVFYSHISAECNLREIIGITEARVFNKLGIDRSHIHFIYTMPFDIEEIEL